MSRLGWSIAGPTLRITDPLTAFATPAACEEVRAAANGATSVHVMGRRLNLRDPLDACIWQACLVLLIHRDLPRPVDPRRD